MTRLPDKAGCPAPHWVRLLMGRIVQRAGHASGHDPHAAGPQVAIGRAEIGALTELAIALSERIPLDEAVEQRMLAALPGSDAALAGLGMVRFAAARAALASPEVGGGDHNAEHEVAARQRAASLAAVVLMLLDRGIAPAAASACAAPYRAALERAAGGVLA